jgi:hypothetical protein
MQLFFTGFPPAHVFETDYLEQARRFAVDKVL